MEAIDAAARSGVMVLTGGPGTGKTTLAKVIANTTNASFRQLNATTSGKKDMEQVVAAICRHTPRAALTLEYNPRLGISNGEVGEDIKWLRCADNVKRKKENI